MFAYKIISSAVQLLFYDVRKYIKFNISRLEAFYLFSKICQALNNRLLIGGCKLYIVTF